MTTEENGFPQYIQSELKRLLRVTKTPQENYYQLSKARKQLLNSVNVFLAANNLEPIDYQNTFSGEDFDNKIKDLFLNVQNHNPGIVSSNLASNPEYNRHMAELFDAVNFYLIDSGAPIKSFDPQNLYPTDEHPESSYPELVSNSSNAVGALNPEKPVLLCFGGGHASRGNDKIIDGMKKIIQELLDEPVDCENHTDFFIMPYPRTFMAYCFAHISRYNAEPETYHSPYASHFVSKYLMPFISRYNEEMQSYERLPIDEMIGKISNINLFGYSYGGVFIQELCNALQKTMQQIGYESEEIRLGLSQVFALTVGNSCRIVEKSQGNFSQCHLISRSDNYIKVFSDTFLAYPMAIEEKATQQLEIDRNQILIVGDAGQQSTIWRTTWEADKPYIYCEQRTDENGHDIRNYLTSSPRTDGIYYPQLAINSLRSAIQKSWKKQPIESVGALLENQSHMQRTYAALIRCAEID